MTVQLKPETERLVQEELQLGRYHSVDEVIAEAMHALQAQSAKRDVTVPAKERKTLYELLTQPPFAGSELNLERQRDFPRPVEL